MGEVLVKEHVIGAFSIETISGFVVMRLELEAL
jgi:hypothetical protein